MKKSNFVSLLYDICGEEGIGIESFSYNWAHRLTRDGVTKYIVGYQFPLNNASSKEICQDKVLTYGILSDAGVPAVLHIFLPSKGSYSGMDREDFRGIAGVMLKKDGKVIVKDNSGTGGNRVFLVSTLEEFDSALDQIFLGAYGAALSPFLEIEEEYRVTMLGEEPLLTIRKQRAYVTGDGESTLRALAGKTEKNQRYLNKMTEEQLASVPEKGERVYLTWKHNLGQGGVGIIEEDPEVLGAVHPIAKAAVRTLGTGFVSVDVVRVNGRYQVLEVNGGVMMEHLSGQDERCRACAKYAYTRAIRTMFGYDKTGEEK